MAKVLEWPESQGHCHQAERSGRLDNLSFTSTSCNLHCCFLDSESPLRLGLLEARGTRLGRFGTFGEYIFHFGGNVTLNFHIPPLSSLLASCPSMASSLEWSSVKIGSCLFWKTGPYEWVSAAHPILRSAPDKSLAAVSISKEGFQGRGRGHICEMTTGVVLLGRYLTPKQKQRVVVVDWLCHI